MTAFTYDNMLIVSALTIVKLIIKLYFYIHEGHNLWAKYIQSIIYNLQSVDPRGMLAESF